MPPIDCSCLDCVVVVSSSLASGGAPGCTRARAGWRPGWAATSAGASPGDVGEIEACGSGWCL